jgi:hypothetical protein
MFIQKLYRGDADMRLIRILTHSSWYQEGFDKGYESSLGSKGRFQVPYNAT